MRAWVSSAGGARRAGGEEGPAEPVECRGFAVAVARVAEQLQGLPKPAAGRAGDAWLEECRQAGAGEFQLTLGYRAAAAPPAKHESTADFLTRLARERAEAERRQAAGELTDPEPEPAAKTMSLADEMRAMGLM